MGSSLAVARPMVHCRQVMLDIAFLHFGEGSSEEMTTRNIIEEASAQGVFEEEEVLENLLDRGKADLVREVMESILDSQGRHVIVSTRRPRTDTSGMEQLDLLGRVWKRADALLPGEQRRSPRKALKAQVLGLFSKAAGSVLSPERAQRAVAFIEALFAEQDREDAGRAV